MRGVAWGGGGQGVARVDVSVDGGSTFTRADLLPKPVTEQRRSQWSWQFFEKTVPLSDSVRSGFIGCKCKYFRIYLSHFREKLQAGEQVDIVLTSKVK